MISSGVDYITIDSFYLKLINKQKKYADKYIKEFGMEAHVKLLFKIKVIVLSAETIKVWS